MSTAWKQTYTGIAYDILNPMLEMIDIRDIAHALANQCRFAGHCDVFYSVAQHCVHASEIAMEQNTPPIFALLHDASEAYLGDLTSPVKHLPMMAPYRELEAKTMDVILRKFQCRPTAYDIEAVGIIDARMLATERRDLMTARSELDLPWNLPHKPYEKEITPWSPRYAEEQFMRRFKSLTGDKR